MRRPKNILMTLFIPYTVLFFILFMLVIGYFISFESAKIRNNSYASVENNVTSILNSFDQTVDGLTSAAQNVLYSNLIKEHFYQYVNSLQKGYSNIDNTKALYDLLIALLGPNTPVNQLYLYDLESSSFGVGLDNSIRDTSVRDLSWYPKVSDDNTSKYLFLDYDERIAPYFSYSEGRRFLTLIQKIYSITNTLQGYLEVKQSLAPFMNTIHSYNLSYREQLLILDPEGTLFDTITEDFPDAASYAGIIMDSTLPENRLEQCLKKESGRQTIFYKTSSATGYTVAAVVDSSDLLVPVRDYITSTLWLLGIICLALAVTSYCIARSISKPLQQMYTHIQALPLQPMYPCPPAALEHQMHPLSTQTVPEPLFPEINTTVLELDALYKALIEMQKQIRQSIEREMQLQNQELQARMLALQAQMNPHFLHNSLATIQAMAAEGMTDEIDFMCQNISELLRYISSDNRQLVTLREELNYTTSYLQCMKIRYGSDLTYEINVPEAMQDYEIPKLCLQLIVENAIKFSTQKRSPWVIRISGYYASDSWTLQIIDNGPGFSKEELTRMNEKIEQINRTNVLPSLEINGMGLMNIYIRFKLLYGNKYIFHLDNNASEGAVITIGGILE